MNITSEYRMSGIGTGTATTEYIPVSKKKFINNLIHVEAENMALREKINLYEKALKNKNLPKILEKNVSENEKIEELDDNLKKRKSTIQKILNIIEKKRHIKTIRENYNIKVNRYNNYINNPDKYEIKILKPIIPQILIDYYENENENDFSNIKDTFIRRLIEYVC